MKKLKSDITDMVKAGVVGGAGGIAIGATGGYGGAGLAAIGSGLGSVGALSSAGAMLRQTKKLGGKKW